MRASIAHELEHRLAKHTVMHSVQFVVRISSGERFPVNSCSTDGIVGTKQEY